MKRATRMLMKMSNIDDRCDMKTFNFSLFTKIKEIFKILNNYCTAVRRARGTWHQS